MFERVLVSKGVDGQWRWRRVSAEGETIVFGTGRFVVSEQAVAEARRVNQEPFILEITPVDGSATVDTSQQVRGSTPGSPQTFFAPFNADQMESLNAFQATTATNPFTCQREQAHGRLVAQPDGWICMVCDYLQGWAYTFMADWSWKGLTPAGATQYPQTATQPTP